MNKIFRPFCRTWYDMQHFLSFSTSVRGTKPTPFQMKWKSLTLN